MQIWIDAGGERAHLFRVLVAYRWRRRILAAWVDVRAQTEEAARRAALLWASNGTREDSPNVAPGAAWVVEVKR